MNNEPVNEMPQTGVVIPVLSELDNICALIDEIRDALAETLRYEVSVVDNASTDRTCDEVEYAAVRYLGEIA